MLYRLLFLFVLRRFCCCYAVATAATAAPRVHAAVATDNRLALPYSRGSYFFRILRSRGHCIIIVSRASRWCVRRRRERVFGRRGRRQRLSPPRKKKKSIEQVTIAQTVCNVKA
uniref:Secreted protein n=1 Tax=Trichogramma kaykai TaxID=54128 RepID=A0ABD2WRG9_9HYME